MKTNIDNITFGSLTISNIVEMLQTKGFNYFYWPYNMKEGGPGHIRGQRHICGNQYHFVKIWFNRSGATILFGRCVGAMNNGWSIYQGKLETNWDGLYEFLQNIQAETNSLPSYYISGMLYDPAHAA